MSEKDEFFNIPEPDNPPSPVQRKKKRGYLSQSVIMLLLGCAVVVLGLIVVDATNSGGAIKQKLISLLGGETELPPAPEPKIIEKVIEVPVEKVIEVPVEKVVEKIVEVEVLPPMPSKYVSWKKIDTAKLWSEIPVKTEMITKQGDTAVVERVRDESFQIEMKVHLTVPKPNQSAEELAGINSHLPKMLNDFETLVKGAEVSPFYHHLYELKTDRIQQKVTRIDELLSRHNFYDLETVLQMSHPSTGAKVLLVQGEMDVVSDGSDGDRWPELDNYISMSPYYQPFTSFGWAKQTRTPNPLLARWEENLKKYEKEFAIPGLTIERNRFLRASIDEHKVGIADLKGRSFLIAEADPFIVLPLSFLGRKDQNSFGPAIGDYAVVIYGDKLYPAIAGDAGPSWKFGEASLRVARHFNEKASPYNRPVSELEITYLIFPGSADKTKSAPDLDAWHARCSELMEGIGGIGDGFELHHWEDLIAKKKADQEAVAVSPESDSTEEDSGADSPAEIEMKAQESVVSGSEVPEAEQP
tara:strand:- start:1601 stop:3181 length:1581 start_codon:yes stop_codon:yes gene_type:complete